MKDLTHIRRFNESEENLNISDVRSSKINESNSSISIKSMVIKYNPVDEEEGVYLGGGDYILELHTDKGIFYHKVKKLGELEDDGPDM